VSAACGMRSSEWGTRSSRDFGVRREAKSDAAFDIQVAFEKRCRGFALPSHSKALGFAALLILLHTFEAGLAAEAPRINPGFSRAPMALAARSVQVPLDPDFHLAFDTELLRVHTAWQGAAASLPAQRRGLERWLATTTGTTLWGNPPVLPWRVTDLVEKRVVDVPFRHQFRGVSAKGGASFLYELAPRENGLVHIHESPRLDVVDGAVVVVRRFELSAAEVWLELLAHADVGRIIDLPGAPAAVLIQRETDVLLVAARGRPVLTWQTSLAPADYTVERISDDDDGSPQLVPQRVTRDEARAHVVIPPHGGEIAFELCTAIVRSRDEAERLVSKLVPVRVAPARMDFVTSAARDTNAPPPLEIQSGAFVGVAPKDEPEFKRERLMLPPQFAGAVTGMDFLPTGELAVCTLGGDVWIARLPGAAGAASKWRRFARGLRAPGALKVVNGVIHLVQQGELTRLVDTDGNGEADLHECVSQGWGFIGHPAHVAAGLAQDGDGALVAALGGWRGLREVPFMGWAVRCATNGADFEGFARGLRAPGGVVAFGAGRDLFATDTRGAWAGACKLVHLREDAVFGFPSTTPAPEEEFKAPAQFDAPAAWLPHSLVKSAGGVVVIEDERFGPWKGQLLVADADGGAVLRVALEKVNGEWQGAVWPLLGKLGARSLAFGPDGRLYAAGGSGAALEQIEFAGRPVVEVKAVHATVEGFDVVFTQPVDAATIRAASFSVRQFACVQGPAEEPQTVDHDARAGKTSTLKVTAAAVDAEGRVARLAVEGRRPGFVTVIQAAGVRSADGRKLRHDTTHFTLNQIPR